MKTNFDSLPDSAQNAVLPTSAAAQPAPDGDWLAAPATGRVRILLGIDVPAEALPAIQADWERVTDTQENAPDLTSAAVAKALRRVQRHAVAVAGVAVLELRENAFAAWVRREAA